MALIADAERDRDLLIALDDAGRAVVLHHLAAAGIDLNTGSTSPHYSSQQLTGLLEPMSARDVELSHGRYRNTDRSLHLRQADVTTDPKPRDWVTVDDVQYEVVDAALQANNRCWELVIREKATMTTTTSTTTSTTTP